VPGPAVGKPDQPHTSYASGGRSIEISPIVDDHGDESLSLGTIGLWTQARFK
jgi:hypothetical protein